MISLQLEDVQSFSANKWTDIAMNALLSSWSGWIKAHRRTGSRPLDLSGELQTMMEALLSRPCAEFEV